MARRTKGGGRPVVGGREGCGFPALMLLLLAQGMLATIVWVVSSASTTDNPVHTHGRVATDATTITSTTTTVDHNEQNDDDTSYTIDICVEVQACLNDTHCAACLRVINSSSPHTVNETIILQTDVIALRTYQVGFVQALLSPTCLMATSESTASANTLAQALLTLNGCARYHENAYGMTTWGICVEYYTYCFLESTCQQCLAALFTHGDDVNSTTEAILQSPECKATGDTHGQQPVTWWVPDLARSCVSFPRCTYYKTQCTNLPDCARCLRHLGAANGTAAAQLCPSGTQAGQLMDKIVQEFCFDSDDDACSYSRYRCADSADCAYCLSSMGSGRSASNVLTDWSTSDCQRALHDSHRDNHPTDGMQYLNAMFSVCPNIAGCQLAVSQCLHQFPDECMLCLNNLSESKYFPNFNESQFEDCTYIYSQYHLITACFDDVCPKSVRTINWIVALTTVVGAVSVLVCLAVVTTLIAHGRTRVSMRDRIVVGLMVANALYSTANTIPLNALREDVLTCGHFALSFEMIRFGRALWFAGKYGLVSFELFIVWASIRTLLRGLSAISSRAEFMLHSLCCLIGTAAFVVFYAVCADINADGYNAATEIEARTNFFDHGSTNDDHDDDQPSQAALSQFQEGRSHYDTLVREMLVAWDVLVGVAICLWVMLRLFHRHALWMLRIEAEIADHAQAADVWAATRNSAWEAHRSLLRARHDAFAEVAKPLEPYILVFVVFAVPAFVMSTRFCHDHSGAEGQTRYLNSGSIVGTASISTNKMTYGACDVWCEFILAFRTLGTVFVYLVPNERRAELASVCTTWHKLKIRVAGCFRRPDRLPYDPLLDRGGLFEMVHLERDPTIDPADDDGVNHSSAAANVDASWEIPESDITRVGQHCLDQGGFGEVWEGRLLPHGHSVAIKFLFADVVDSDGEVVDTGAEEDFREECLVLQTVNSPHLLKFFGFGMTSAGRRFLVTELMRGGSLHKKLYDPTQHLMWRTRVAIGLQVALGMEYLHERRIVHRDLKSANVLLDEELRAKVCDFGLTRIVRPPRQHVIHSPFTGVTRRLSIEDGAVIDAASAALHMENMGVCVEDASGKMTKAVGTMLWMAPEVFRGDQNYGPKIDVYSFGMVLWELATRQLPWLDLSRKDSDFFNELNRALQTGRRSTIPDDVLSKHPQFVAVMRRCYAGDPVERPPFTVVAEELAVCLRDHYPAI